MDARSDSSDIHDGGRDELGAAPADALGSLVDGVDALASPAVAAAADDEPASGACAATGGGTAAWAAAAGSEPSLPAMV